MDICEEICRFEELIMSTLRWRLFLQKKRILISIRIDFYKVGRSVGRDRKDCCLTEQASMKFESGLAGSNTSCDCGDTPDEVARIVDWPWSCVRPEKISLSLPPAGMSRLKEFDSLSKTPSDGIQSCQGLPTGTSGEIGRKGWNPRTRISWIINKEGKGT